MIEKTEAVNGKVIRKEMEEERDVKVNKMNKSENPLKKKGEENVNGEVVGGPVYEQLRAWPIVCESHPGVYLIHGGLERPFSPPEDVTAFLPSLVWDYVKEAQSVMAAAGALFGKQTLI